MDAGVAGSLMTVPKAEIFLVARIPPFRGLSVNIDGAARPDRSGASYRPHAWQGAARRKKQTPIS